MLFRNLNKERPVYDGIRETIPNSLFLNETKTVVIGGGLLGLSTALSLAEAGHDVVVVEMNKIGDGPSGRSGGQLWPGYPLFLSEMEKKFGHELTRKAWNFTDEAVGEIHKRLYKVSDKCDFAPGLILTSKTKSQATWIKKESEVFKNFGLDFATYLSREDLKKYINTDLYYNGILFTGETERQYGHINPLKYTQTIALFAREAGALLAEETVVEEVSQIGGERYRVTTSRGSIITKNVVFATGANFLRPKGIDYRFIPRTYIPTQTVILATEPISEHLAYEMIPGGSCFCDASSIAMNYVALVPDSKKKDYYRLTFGGADALMQITVGFEISKMEREMRNMFPQLNRENIKIEKVWGGGCDLSKTFMPTIANPREGIFHADGFSGQGMVNTTLYGMTIADKILGKDTGRFEILQQLNPPEFSKNILVAWLQAITAVF